MFEIIFTPTEPTEVVQYQGTNRAETYGCADKFGGNYGLNLDMRGGDDRPVASRVSTNCEKMTLQGPIAARMGEGNDHARFTTTRDAIIDGHGGNDQLFITASYCMIRGGAGNDELRGDCPQGAYLYGGPGADLMHATNNPERFYFTPANTKAGKGNRDSVRGFQQPYDKIVLIGDADKKKKGHQGYRFVGVNKKPAPGTVGYYRSGPLTIVTGYDGKTRFEISLEEFKGTLSQLDFLIR